MEMPVRSPSPSSRGTSSLPGRHAERTATHDRCGFSLPSLLLLLLVAGAIAYAVYSWQSAPAPALFPLAAESRDHAPTPPGFGAVRWHMSPAALRAIEGTPPFRTSPSAIAYQLSILDKPCLLTYVFRSEQLCGARLQFAAPDSAFLPGIPPNRARKAYEWLKRHLEDRYGKGVETRATRPRPETEEYERRLREARQRYAEGVERIRRRYGAGEAAASHIGRELASEKRYIADLEQWLEDTRSADRDNPLLARLATHWSEKEVTIELLADFTTDISSLEIRYKAPPPRRRPAAGDEL